MPTYGEVMHPRRRRPDLWSSLEQWKNATRPAMTRPAMNGEDFHWTELESSPSTPQEVCCVFVLPLRSTEMVEQHQRKGMSLNPVPFCCFVYGVVYSGESFFRFVKRLRLFLTQNMEYHVDGILRTALERGPGAMAELVMCWAVSTHTIEPFEVFEIPQTHPLFATSQKHGHFLNHVRAAVELWQSPQGAKPLSFQKVEMSMYPVFPETVRCYNVSAMTDGGPLASCIHRATCCMWLSTVQDRAMTAAERDRFRRVMELGCDQRPEAIREVAQFLRDHDASWALRFAGDRRVEEAQRTALDQLLASEG